MWARRAANTDLGETFTMSPLIFEDLILIGPAGSENGISGWVGAFRLSDGTPVWRFETVPGAKEKGNKSWGNPNNIPLGGGSVWTPFSLDPVTGQLYVAVTNPAPDLPGDQRPGDNLYTNSMVVLDVHTGKLLWHKQMVANDSHDYDLTQVSPLFTASIQGHMSSLVATVGKDGMMRVVDRNSREVIHEAAVTTVENSQTPVTTKGVHACPGVLGGVEWNGPAYNPGTNMLYVGAVDWCSTFKSAEVVKRNPGRGYMGGTVQSGQDFARMDHGCRCVDWHGALEVPIAATGSWCCDHHVGRRGFRRRAHRQLRRVRCALRRRVVPFQYRRAHRCRNCDLRARRQAIRGGDVGPPVTILDGSISRCADDVLARIAVAVMRLPIALILATLCRAQNNPLASDSQAAETGRWMFRIFCSPCHGIHAEGGRGPDLTLGTYSAGDRDGDLFRAISRGVPGSEMPGYAGRIEDDGIWRLVSYIRSVARHEAGNIPGDAAAGEKVFWGKGGCGQCHRVGAKGDSIGPDLSSAGRRRSLTYLRSSILTPDGDVTPGSSTITVVKRDGTKIVGVEKSFDNFSAQLMDLSGRYYSFLREDVTSMTRESRSLMPSTYGKVLSENEINDLLAYLNSLRGGR